MQATAFLVETWVGDATIVQTRILATLVMAAIWELQIDAFSVFRIIIRVVLQLVLLVPPRMVRLDA